MTLHITKGRAVAAVRRQGMIVRCRFGGQCDGMLRHRLCADMDPTTKRTEWTLKDEVAFVASGSGNIGQIRNKGSIERSF